MYCSESNYMFDCLIRMVQKLQEMPTGSGGFVKCVEELENRE